MFWQARRRGRRLEHGSYICFKNQILMEAYGFFNATQIYEEYDVFK
jgi:hypothetical protein